MAKPSPRKGGSPRKTIEDDVSASRTSPRKRVPSAKATKSPSPARVTKQSPAKPKAGPGRPNRSVSPEKPTTTSAARRSASPAKSRKISPKKTTPRKSDPTYKPGLTLDSVLAKIGDQRKLTKLDKILRDNIQILEGDAEGDVLSGQECKQFAEDIKSGNVKCNAELWKLLCELFGEKSGLKPRTHRGSTPRQASDEDEVSGDVVQSIEEPHSRPTASKATPKAPASKRNAQRRSASQSPTKLGRIPDLSPDKTSGPRSKSLTRPVREATKSPERETRAAPSRNQSPAQHKVQKRQSPPKAKANRPMDDAVEQYQRVLTQAQRDTINGHQLEPYNANVYPLLKKRQFEAAQTIGVENGKAARPQKSGLQSSLRKANQREQTEPSGELFTRYRDRTQLLQERSPDPAIGRFARTQSPPSSKKAGATATTKTSAGKAVPLPSPSKGKQAATAPQQPALTNYKDGEQAVGSDKERRGKIFPPIQEQWVTVTQKDEKGNVKLNAKGQPITETRNNPFFETMPAPEVWHRRMPPYFPFGETPYMEQVMSDQINEDLARSHDEMTKEKEKSGATPSTSPKRSSWNPLTWLGRGGSESPRREEPDEAESSSRARKAPVKRSRMNEMWDLPEPHVAGGRKRTAADAPSGGRPSKSKRSH